MTTYILTVDDDPHLLGRTRVRLHRADFPIPGEAVGKSCGSITVPTNQHVGMGANALLSGQYGNPDDKPALRKVDSTEGTLCVSRDGSRLAWLPDDDYQGA